MLTAAPELASSLRPSAPTPTCAPSPTFRAWMEDRECYRARRMRDRNVVNAFFFSIFVAAALAACSFPEPPNIDPDASLIDAAPIDSTVVDPDAPVEQADLTTSQLPHDFDDVSVGQLSSILQVVIRNIGEATSSTITVTMAGDDQAHFDVVPTGDTTDCAGATLDPEATCIVQVRFAPDDVGPRNAQLEVSATNGGIVTLGLMGNGLSPGNLEITAGATLPFGTIEIGSMSTTQTVTVRNNGGSPTAALDTVLGDETNYAITSDACEGAPLAAGASCNVVVRFDPTVVGSLPTSVAVRESVTVGVSAAASGTGSARIQVSKTGAGTVASSPAGISCGAGCSSATVAFTQTPVTLTATEDSGYAFDGWTGACASANPSPTCQLALTSPLTTAGAAFVQVFTMTVTTSGSGTVTSSPAGVVCGNGNTDCDEVYEAGTMVTLTAEPSAGWGVYAWGGTGTTCAALSNTCVVSMTQARNVTVELRERFTLGVSLAGTGSGTVTSGGINCPGTCSVTVFDGTAITLTEAPASAAAGSQNIFSSWGGACSGGLSTCMVTVDAAKTVNATFTLQHQLSATIAGTGTGSVSGPGGFMCSSGTCSTFYDAGSTVAVTPMAGASSSFEAFSGDCTGATCSLMMSAPRAATASFRLWDCTPDTIVCNDTTDVYTECASDGTVAFQMDCPLECATGVEKCLDVDPSNDLAAYLDMAPSGPDVDFTAGSISSINTDTGAVLRDGSSYPIPNASVSGVRVFWMQSLNISGVVTVSGTAPFAMLVDGDVTITGTLDLSANSITNGPGATTGSCQGTATSGTISATPGAGGSGKANAGASGGNSSGPVAGGAGGASIANEAPLEPLTGGCKGGQATAGGGAGVARGYGGGGGGAVQIVSRTSIRITSTGVLDASGGGGTGGENVLDEPAAGGGGGSGGGILLEAPDVLLDGNGVVLSTKGGGGGGVGPNANGADGGTSSGQAAGGDNLSTSYPTGGAGGTGAGSISTTLPGGGQNSNASSGHGAGGGGSVGRTRINNTAGSVALQNGAAIRSYGTYGILANRQVP